MRRPSASIMIGQPGQRHGPVWPGGVSAHVSGKATLCRWPRPARPVLDRHRKASLTVTTRLTSCRINEASVSFAAAPGWPDAVNEVVRKVSRQTGGIVGVGIHHLSAQSVIAAQANVEFLSQQRIFFVCNMVRVMRFQQFTGFFPCNLADRF